MGKKREKNPDDHPHIKRNYSIDPEFERVVEKLTRGVYRMHKRNLNRWAKYDDARGRRMVINDTLMRDIILASIRCAAEVARGQYTHSHADQSVGHVWHKVREYNKID